MIPPDTKPHVFLSSTFSEEIDREWKYVPLRRRILDNYEMLPVKLWAYDLFWPKDSEFPEPDADTIIDRCFDGIRKCDLFVFLLTTRHGTGAGYTRDPVLASYLELELFAAAMLQKPVLVLHQRDHEPQPELHDALNLLQKTFPADRYVVGGDNDLYNRFLVECDRLATGNKSPSKSILARLPDWLSRRRSAASFDEELADPHLHFLDGNFGASQKAADPDKAKLLLDQVVFGTRGSPAKLQIMPHGAALFRLWAAMRELMDKDDRAAADPSLAQLWDRAWGLWASHASWFGLHGHLWMGPLASVQSQIDLRRRLSAEASFRAAVDIREPVGARASALYSVAQRMHSRAQKLRQFRMAAALATQAIERDENAAHGALSIRGHASMQLARLGYAWKVWEAETDFKQALELRKRSGASPASTGEATVDLGLCLVLTGHWRSGVALLQEGVSMMRGENSANGKAFLARALRSLERGARRAGRRDISESARDERLMLATQIEAMDQTRDV